MGTGIAGGAGVLSVPNRFATPSAASIVASTSVTYQVSMHTGWWDKMKNATCQISKMLMSFAHGISGACYLVFVALCFM